MLTLDYPPAGLLLAMTFMAAFQRVVRNFALSTCTIKQRVGYNESERAVLRAREAMLIQVRCSIKAFGGTQALPPMIWKVLWVRYVIL
jgi:hypothetical protein